MQHSFQRYYKIKWCQLCNVLFLPALARQRKLNKVCASCLLCFKRLRVNKGIKKCDWDANITFPIIFWLKLVLSSISCVREREKASKTPRSVAFLHSLRLSLTFKTHFIVLRPWSSFWSSHWEKIPIIPALRSAPLLFLGSVSISFKCSALVSSVVALLLLKKEKKKKKKKKHLAFNKTKFGDQNEIF